MNVDFSKRDALSNINELFTNMGVREMLEYKDLGVLDMVLSFVTTFFGRATRFVQSAPLTQVQTMYTEPIHRLIKNCDKEEARLDVQLDVKFISNF